MAAWNEPGTGSAFSYLSHNWKKQNPYRVWKPHVIIHPRWARSSPTTGFQKHNCYAVTLQTHISPVIVLHFQKYNCYAVTIWKMPHCTTQCPLASYNDRYSVEQYIPVHLTISIKSWGNFTDFTTVTWVASARNLTQITTRYGINRMLIWVILHCKVTEIAKRGKAKEKIKAVLWFCSHTESRFSMKWYIFATAISCSSDWLWIVLINIICNKYIPFIWIYRIN